MEVPLGTWLCQRETKKRERIHCDEGRVIWDAELRLAIGVPMGCVTICGLQQVRMRRKDDGCRGAEMSPDA